LLRQRGLANGAGAGVKILGTGELKKKLNVHARAFSAAAKAKIESLGGVCTVITAKPAAPSA
jgi:large subunit ribosomal protein L15